MTGLGEILQENQALRTQLGAAVLDLDSHKIALQETKQELALRDAMIAELKEKAEQLAKTLELLKLKKTGPKNERFVADAAQEPLPFPQDIQAPPRAPQPEDTELADESDDAVDGDGEDNTQPENRATQRSAKNTPKRRNRNAFSHLPARNVACAADKDTTCAGCGGALNVIGKAESFRIEWVPGHFIRQEVTRDKCACPKCPEQGVLTVPGPYALNRALCGNGLLARVLVDKFADHIPLNRQARRMAREGVELSTNTLAAWVLNSAGLLHPIAQQIHKSLMAGDFLQGDDTGFPVQDQGDGTLRNGRLWAFTDQSQVFYAFTDTKQGHVPAQLLDAFKAREENHAKVLLVDGGSEFNQAVRDLGLKRGGCWSHLRRYFFEARHHHPKEAQLALQTIRDVFLIEREIRDKQERVGIAPDTVLAIRKAKSQPLVDGLFYWVKQVSQMVRPKSSLGDAVKYARNQEASLRLFLEHGGLPLHNNLSELLLRQGVVGRKNWLFARSEGGALAAGTMYTLIGSCMLQGIDPQAYLVDVLGRLSDEPATRLTPKAWMAARA